MPHLSPGIYIGVLIFYIKYILVGLNLTRGSSLFFGKVHAVGVLRCFALIVVCMALLASFFLPSASLINMYSTVSFTLAFWHALYFPILLLLYYYTSAPSFTCLHQRSFRSHELHWSSNTHRRHFDTNHFKPLALAPPKTEAVPLQPRHPAGRETATAESEKRPSSGVL